MSLTKITPSMIIGSIYNAMNDPAVDGTGTLDSTSALNSALANHNIVEVTGVIRCDGTIVIPQETTLILNGKLWRQSAHSSSTAPVVQLIGGDSITLVGYGLQSVIKTDNNAPNGVVLVGAIDPTSTYVNMRDMKVGNLRISCRSDGTGSSSVNKTLAIQNSQYWLGGALYDGIFSDLFLYYGDKQVYLNPISNAHNFSNINCWGTRGYTVYLDGNAAAGYGGGQGLVTDNNFINFMVDGSPHNITSYYGRNVNNCAFTNCSGEPGAGSWRDFNTTCSAIYFSGYNNHSSAGTFTALNSVDINNGAIDAFQVNTPSLNGVGGTVVIADVSGTTYNGLTFNPSTTPYGGAGGVTVTPNAAPGSGTSQVYTYFKNSGSIGALGQHNVAIDGGIFVGKYISPMTDGTVSVGSGSLRMNTYYGIAGAINTSDANEKQQIQLLTSTEKVIANQIKSLIKTFKFNDAVAAKGNAARIHVGVIAQDVRDAFVNNGLDPEHYGMFCSDTWIDDQGVSHTRLGVRYDELLAFIIGAM